MKKNLKEHHEEAFGNDESYDTFVNEIKSMAEGIMQLSLQAVQIYTPIINRIISDTSATQHEVEYLMDFMLSLCYTEEFTNQFKKLCRGIFSRFPDTVYCYAKYYFEEYELNLWQNKFLVWISMVRKSRLKLVKWLNRQTALV